MKTVLEGLSNSEAVFELNKVTGRKITLHRLQAEPVTGVVSSASVIGAVVSVELPDEEFLRIPLAEVVGMEEA